MNKIKIGIPRTYYSYEDGKFLKLFLEELNFEVIISSCDYNDLNNSDNNCLFFNHLEKDFNYLNDICDYVINIKLLNEGIDYQGCPNNNLFFDLGKSICHEKLINITIDHLNYKTLYKELLKIFNKMSIDKKMIKNAYLFTKIKISKMRKEEIVNNTNILFKGGKKYLLIGQSFILDNTNIFDSFNDINFITYNKFDKEKLKSIPFNYLSNIYYKYGKEVLSAIEYVKDNVDGIIYLSTKCCPVDKYMTKIICNRYDLPFYNIDIFNIDKDSLRIFIYND